MSERRFERWRDSARWAGRGFIAYHEAGHAVAAYLLKIRIDFVTIISETGGEIAGYLRHGPLPGIERGVMLALAGPVVDEFINSPLGGSEADKAHALDLAEQAIGSNDQLQTYIDRLWSQTWDLLTDPEHWRAIEHVAEALLAGDDILLEEEIVNEDQGQIDEFRIGRKRVRQIIEAAIG